MLSINSLAAKIFGTSNDRKVKGYRARVEAINALEPELVALSDEELRARTVAFRKQIEEGATLDDDFPERLIEGMRRGSPDGVNSLLADRLAGRPMEADARNGAVVRAGLRHGVPTPLNAMALALLNALA